MKNLNLNAYGVSEMRNAEMREIDGGWIIPFILGAIVGGMIYDLVNNTAECCAAMSDGYNDARW